MEVQAAEPQKARGGGEAVIPSEDERIDELELGKTIQLLYDAFSSVLAASGSLSPYVPTLESTIPIVVAYIETLARRGRGQPVYYEPGCGAGHVASSVTSSTGYHTVCLELDETLAAEAARRLRESPNADVVVGDLSSFRPRRVNIVYAYLLPRAVDRVLEQLQGTGAPVVSLDYPAESDTGHLRVAVLEAGYRHLYIYIA